MALKMCYGCEYWHPDFPKAKPYLCSICKEDGFLMCEECDKDNPYFKEADHHKCWTCREQESIGKMR